MSSSGYVHLDIDEILRETDKAFLVVYGTDFGERTETWIPKSQIADVDDYEVGDRNLTLSVSQWFAEKEGLDE